VVTSTTDPRPRTVFFAGSEPQEVVESDEAVGLSGDDQRSLRAWSSSAQPGQVALVAAQALLHSAPGPLQLVTPTRPPRIHAII